MLLDYYVSKHLQVLTMRYFTFLTFCCNMSSCLLDVGTSFLIGHARISQVVVAFQITMLHIKISDGGSAFFQQVLTIKPARAGATWAPRWALYTNSPSGGAPIPPSLARTHIQDQTFFYPVPKEFVHALKWGLTFPGISHLSVPVRTACD